jgi:membrane associated rhomboid family serine protease
MIEAPVGFQCPECVREGNRDLKQGRTISGGAVRRDPVLITKILVAVNVLLYGLQFISNDRVTSDYAMRGVNIAFLDEWYRLITSAFLHVGVMHLALNMLALWIVGGAIEPRLGRWRYLTVYLVSALAGSTLSYLVDPLSQPSVGASGAVFGLFGALFVLALRLRFDVRGVIALIAINVVIGFMPGLNINWRAHLGGLVAGTILTAVMVYAPQRHRLWMSVGASALLVLACVLGTTMRTNQARDCIEQQQAFPPCDTGFWGPSG